MVYFCLFCTLICILIYMNSFCLLVFSSPIQNSFTSPDNSAKNVIQEIINNDFYGPGGSENTGRHLLGISTDPTSVNTEGFIQHNNSKINPEVNCNMCVCPAESSYNPVKCEFCCNATLHTEVKNSSIQSENEQSFSPNDGVVSDTVIGENKNSSLINFYPNCDICKCPLEINSESEKCKLCSPCKSQETSTYKLDTSGGKQIEDVTRNHSGLSASSDLSDSESYKINCELCHCPYEDSYNPDKCKFCKPCESEIESVVETKVVNNNNFKEYNITFPESVMPQFKDLKEHADEKTLNSDYKIIITNTSTTFVNSKLYVFVVGIMAILVLVLVVFLFFSYKKAKYIYLRRNYL